MVVVAAAAVWGSCEVVLCTAFTSGCSVPPHVTCTVRSNDVRVTVHKEGGRICMVLMPMTHETYNHNNSPQ